MRFLADAGVSPKTVEFLRQLGHDAVHVRTLGLQRSPDLELVDRARADSSVVLTFDLDFGSHPRLSWQGSRRLGKAVRRLQMRLPLEERPESGQASHVRAENVRGVRIHLADQGGTELERRKSNKAFPL